MAAAATVAKRHTDCKETPHKNRAPLSLFVVAASASISIADDDPDSLPATPTSPDKDLIRLCRFYENLSSDSAAAYVKNERPSTPDAFPRFSEPLAGSVNRAVDGVWHK